MAYANPGDVATNLGRPLSAAEVAQAELWIGWAESTIAKRLGALSALDADTVCMVVTEAVTARLRSPEPLTQVDVQVDDGSISKRYQKSSGLIEILPEWWAELGDSSATNDGAFSITPYFVPVALDAWA